MLDAKAISARKLEAQAIASLMIFSQNQREIKKDSVPNLVQLFDPSQFLVLDHFLYVRKPLLCHIVR